MKGLLYFLLKIFVIDMLKNRIQGCVWVLVGVFLFSIVFSLPKFVSQTIPVLQIAFIRYFAGFITVSFPYILGKERASEHLDSRQGISIWVHLIRSILGVLTILCIIYASGRIPLANVQVLSLTNGIFVLFFSVIFLKERLQRKTVVAAILCLTGVVVAANPSFGSSGGWLSTGTLVAIMSAIFWAGEVIILKLTVCRERVTKILMIVNGIAACLLVIPAILSWQRINLHQIIILSAMGPVAIVGQFCNIQGFRLTDASVLVPIRYTGIISSTLVGIFFFGEWPSSSTLFGGSLIVLGGIYVSLSLLNP